MSEQINNENLIKIKEKLKNGLSGNTLDNALDFVDYLTNLGMTADIEAHPTFYYQGEWLLLLDAIDNNFMICSWPGELDVAETDNFSVDEALKTFARGFVKKCFDCGGCSDSENPGPMDRIVFGQEYANVCCNIFHFWNPDEKQIENGKILMKLLTCIIDSKKRTE